MGQRAKGMASRMKLRLCLQNIGALCFRIITMMHDAEAGCHAAAAEAGCHAAAAAAAAAAAERWLALGLLMSSS